MTALNTHDTPENRQRLQPSIRDKLFSCSTDLEQYTCPRCPNFSTNYLTEIRHHIQNHHRSSHKKCPCHYETSSYFFPRYITDTPMFSTEENKRIRSIDSNSNVLTVTTLKNQWFQCDNCFFQTKCKRSLKRHLHVHKELLHCAHCKYETTSKKTLATHVRRDHTTEQWLECDHCPFKTNSESQLNHHKILKHETEGKWIQCGLCSYKCVSVKVMWRHEDTKHCALSQHYFVEKYNSCLWYQCGLCDYKTSNKGLFKRHNLRSHAVVNIGELFKCMKNNLEQYQCQECGNFQSDFLIDLKEHITQGHSLTQAKEKRLYKCPCFQTYSEYLWIQHKVSGTCISNRTSTTDRKIAKPNVTSNTVHKCDKCPFESPFRGNLLRHLQKHTNWVKCDMCSFQTKYVFNMTLHKKFRHEIDVEWFHCDNCIFKTKRKYSLKLHMQTRHNVKYFNCDHCSYEGSTITDLNTHKRTEHEDVEGDFLFCSQCLFKSKNQDVIRRHQEKHKEKFHQCPYCPQKSKRRYNLKTHILQKHTKLDSIQWLHCDYCEFKSKTKSILKRHTQEKHSQEHFDCAHCGYRAKSKRLLINHLKAMHERG